MVPKARHLADTTFSLLRSPWGEVFDCLLAKAREDLLLAAPYMTRSVAHRITSRLAGSVNAQTFRLHLATDLRPSTLLAGAGDIESLLLLADAFGGFALSHVPGLHAKVYVADDAMAVVTSGNLTEGGLFRNLEYGVLLSDATSVSQVRKDITAYCSLGAEVLPASLAGITNEFRELKIARDEAYQSVYKRARQTFDKALRKAELRVMEERARNETTHSIFSRTIEYLLGRGPMRTVELHPLIRAIHPDLCDDSIDRVIGGVHFGKRWKHYVRNAQQHLRRRGVIRFERGVWSLAE